METYLGGLHEAPGADPGLQVSCMRGPKQARFPQEPGSQGDPRQRGPCSEASHSSCQLINWLFTEFSPSFPAGTLDRVFHIFIAKKKINTTLGKPRHLMEKEVLLPVSG